MPRRFKPPPVRDYLNPKPPPTPEVPDETEEEDEDSFEQLCKDLREERRMTQAQLGAWFGVSGKTYSRWENGSGPTKTQTLGILVVLRANAPDYAERARLTLAAEQDEEPKPAPAIPAAPAPLPPPIANPAVVRAALDGAIFEAAEKLGVSSARTREVAVLLFERAALLGLGVGDATAILRGGTPPA